MTKIAKQTIETFKEFGKWHATVRDENNKVIHACVRKTKNEAVSAAKAREPRYFENGKFSEN